MNSRVSAENKEYEDQGIHFDLTSFFPYLVRVFYTDVSRAVSLSYRDVFDMTPAEWRSMVIIGPEGALTANEIVMRSSMDKVSVSRAISRMKKSGLIDIQTNIDDGRSKILKLSPKGIRVFKYLVPKVKEVEKRLLAGVTESQKDQFIRTMIKIRQNSESLI